MQNFQGNKNYFCTNEKWQNNFTGLDDAEGFSSTNILKHQKKLKPGGVMFLSETLGAKHRND
jgi:hypothetical protein